MFDINSIYYAFSIVGMLAIVWWYVRNDGRATTSGLLAMKQTSEK